MFRGLSSGKFIQLYEVFGTGPLMPDTLATFRALLDQPFPKHWRAKVPQQQAAMPGAHPAAASIASLTLEVRQTGCRFTSIECFKTNVISSATLYPTCAAAAEDLSVFQDLKHLSFISSLAVTSAGSVSCKHVKCILQCEVSVFGCWANSTPASTCSTDSTLRKQGSS